MDYINIQGDENTVILELSKYMNQGGAKLMIQNLTSFMDTLDEDDVFNITKEMPEQKDGLGFIVPKTNYYLNIKKQLWHLSDFFSTFSSRRVLLLLS